MIRIGRRKQTSKNGHLVATPFVVTAADAAPFLDLPPEAAASLRYTIGRIARDGGFPRRLALVSSLFGEGVTFLSQAIGALIASDYDLRVAVVELNWWRPAPSIITGEDQRSLADLINVAALTSEVLIETELSNLAIVQAGEIAPAHRAMTARSAALQEALDWLDEDFDHLILDVPAILGTSDAVPLAALADSCCLVIRQGVTPLEQVSLALDEISHLPLAGVILNQAETATPDWILKRIPQR